jgi:hypothetical protein
LAVTAAERWVPQNARHHPPFEPGNDAAVKHGAFSPKLVEQDAKRLVDAVLEDESLGFLRNSSFGDALQRWANHRAAADRLLAHLVRHHEPKPCPGCKRCLAWEARWLRMDTTAERAAEKLGLDPAARAEMLARLVDVGLWQREDDPRSLLRGLAEALGLVPREDAEAVEEAPAERALSDAGDVYDRELPRSSGVAASVLRHRAQPGEGDES